MSQQLIEKILSNSATPAEVQQFETWLNTASKNRNYFNKTKAIWDSLDNAFQTKTFEKESARDNIDLRISVAKTNAFRLKRYRQFAYAASILILVSMSLFVGNKVKQSNQINQVYAANNAVLEIHLVDGSHVWLNKNSTLKIPENFALKSRTVTLKGEAYFEVKHDETKPFKINTGKTVTKVLGTSFNIEMDTLTGNVSLDVNSGKVAFYQKHWLGNEYYLTAGVFAQYLANENRILISKNESLNYLAWKTGKLKFYDTPINQVCTDLEKYYGVKITSNLSNGTILTGTFDHEELESVLSVIKLSLGVEITVENGVYVLSR